MATMAEFSHAWRLYSFVREDSLAKMLNYIIAAPEDDDEYTRFKYSRWL